MRFFQPFSKTTMFVLMVMDTLTKFEYVTFCHPLCNKK